MGELLRLVRDVDEALDRCVARHPAARFALTQREAEIAEDLAGIDPACRYLADDDAYPGHVCTRNTGEPVRLGETCRFEAHAQLHAPTVGRAVAGVDWDPVYEARQDGAS